MGFSVDTNDDDDDDDDDDGVVCALKKYLDREVEEKESEEAEENEDRMWTKGVFLRSALGKSWDGLWWGYLSTSRFPTPRLCWGWETNLY
ncbi:hypothetical protein PV326_004655 [Microctonus aethiopoides]|nr:hypothetical protein PV326_004655 [Microctonus aethiopoides]